MAGKNSYSETQSFLLGIANTYQWLFLAGNQPINYDVFNRVCRKYNVAGRANGVRDLATCTNPIDEMAKPRNSFFKEVATVLIFDEEIKERDPPWLYRIEILSKVVKLPFYDLSVFV